MINPDDPVDEVLATLRELGIVSGEDVDELDNAISRDAVQGERYPEQMMGLLNN